MTTTDFTFRLLSAQSPQEVFQAICRVNSWWTGYYSETITGHSEKLHDEFEFTAGDGAHYSKQQLIAVEPGKRLVWLITDSRFNYIEQADEWTGTRVVFDILATDKGTELTFTHAGLTPEVECYGACAPAWTQYMEHRLAPLIQAIPVENRTNSTL